MVTLALILAFAAFVTAAEEVSPDSKHIFSLYDSKAHQFQNNTLSYEEFNKAFSKDGYYKFNEFQAGFNHYSNFPTLIVYQPDEKVKELNGFYFPKGSLSVLTYCEDNPTTFELFRPVREYLLQNSTEVATPFAATYAYPYFYEYHLVKFVSVGEVAPKFAVFFVAPNQLRKTGISDYNEVVRYYYNEKTKTIKEVF